MTKKYLIIIDMQNDFCTGTLKNDAASAIVPFIKKKIIEFRESGYKIVYTRDTHNAETYSASLEGRHLPVAHCLKGTEGWQIVPEIAPEDGDIVIDKTAFAYSGWGDVLKDGAEVYMAGTCTDICVVSNALAIKAALPNTEVFIFKDGCAGLSPEKHLAALDVMSSCQCSIL